MLKKSDAFMSFDCVEAVLYGSPSREEIVSFGKEIQKIPLNVSSAFKFHDRAVWLDFFKGELVRIEVKIYLSTKPDRIFIFCPLSPSEIVNRMQIAFDVASTSPYVDPVALAREYLARDFPYFNSQAESDLSIVAAR